MRPLRYFFAFSLLIALIASTVSSTWASPSLLPAMATAVEENLNAKAAVLMDMGTKQVLISKNADERLPIASVTKVMTMLLALDALESGQISLEEMVTASPHACSYGGAQIYLEPGEQFSVREMLMAVAIKSANDAAVALAEHVAGSESAFVAAMNKRAQDLGMEDTNFINACGLDSISVTGKPDDQGYSSAHDVGLMSIALLKHQDLLKEWLTTRITYLQRAKGPVELFNTNHRFIRGFSGADGLKTGLTDLARHCLSATAERDGFRLIAVVLGVPSDEMRYQDVTQLLNYGFANYIGRVVVPAGSEITTVQVNRGQERQIALTTQEPLAVLLKKGQSLDAIEQQIELPAKIFAPIANGDKIGVLKLVDGGNVVAEADLVTTQDVPRLGLIGNFVRMLRSWLGE